MKNFIYSQVGREEISLETETLIVGLGQWWLRF